MCKQRDDVSMLNRLKLSAKVTMYMLGGNSKEIFELFINKLVFFWVSVTKMKLMILAPHLIIGRAFRYKCILDCIMK